VSSGTSSHVTLFLTLFVSAYVTLSTVGYNAMSKGTYRPNTLTKLYYVGKRQTDGRTDGQTSESLFPLCGREPNNILYFLFMLN